MIEPFEATLYRDSEREPAPEGGGVRAATVSGQRHKGAIMIVDDEPANLKLLEDMLRQQGYSVRSFPRGRLALAAARLRAPDLILLDINMPEMNGYEVCRLFKSEQGLSKIPVIFLSALNDIADKVQAFRSGDIDYITKPFQFEEVQARIETHLELERLQRALRAHNDRLEDLVSARTRKLREAHAQLQILDKTKSDFLSLISHEFRTPLNGLFGIGELILDDLPSNPESQELRELYEQSRRRILAILDDAILLAQIEAGAEKFAPAPLPLASIVRAAIEQAADFAASRDVVLEPPTTDASWVLGSEKLMVKALRALVETAVKFSKAREGVRVVCPQGSDIAQVVIESCGSALPAAVLPKFFDLFSIRDAVSSHADLGLDAPLAYRVLAVFGARVRVENRDVPGIRLTVSLKRAG